MLNVPDTVKALFKRDGVRKNFRVHFPNNELPDITNANIVQESVKFTESLCSQDVLKFGLTEASVIEFETVGIGNMYGMDIDCGIEIDLSSLSAADISAIAAGTWDGTYCAVGDSDIGYAYFRIPYGRFRVESCPRDHQAMSHRKVQAYSYSPTDLNDNPFELRKQNTLNVFPNYTPNLYYFMMENVAYNVSKVMGDEGFIGTDVPTSNYQPTSTDTVNEWGKTITVKLSGGGTADIVSAVSFAIGYTDGTGWPNTPRKIELNQLYSADLKGVNYNAILTEIANALRDSHLNIDLWESGYTSWKELARDFLARDNGISLLYPGVIYYPQVTNYGGFKPYQKVDIKSNLNTLYPYIGSFKYDDINYIYGCFYIPKSFYLASSGIIIRKQISSADQASFKVWNGTAPSMSMSFPATGTGTINCRGMKNAYTFGGEVTVRDMINGYIEMIAAFGKIGRDGGFQLVRLSKSSPVSILPGEYSGFWWDEYDVLPIGYVKYTYTDSENNEIEATYQFDTGPSIYDLSGNSILKASGKSSEGRINGLLDTNFIPHLSAVAFTPIEMTMKGMPWIEAGDYLAVAAEDGTIANSFAMRVEISGIQVLSLAVESTSGEILSSSEGS